MDLGSGGQRAAIITAGACPKNQERFFDADGTTATAINHGLIRQQLYKHGDARLEYNCRGYQQHCYH
jgi:hypothetical protein